MKTPSGDLNSRLTDSCYTLTHCTMLLGNSFGKENFMKLYLILIGTMSQYEGVPYQFNLNMNLKSPY